jgi:hypothetical protein
MNMKISYDQHCRRGQNFLFFEDGISEPSASWKFYSFRRRGTEHKVSILVTVAKSGKFEEWQIDLNFTQRRQ